MQSWLYIALYRRGLVGSYHWTIIPSASQTGPLDETEEFQISDKSGTWELVQREARLKLGAANVLPLVGCVRLPTVFMGRAEVAAFISEYSPAEEPDSERWSCARWIIRIVHDLVEAELVRIDLAALQDDVFYQKVIGRGMQLEAATGNGKVFSGIRVVDY